MGNSTAWAGVLAAVTALLVAAERLAARVRLRARLAQDVEIWRKLEDGRERRMVWAVIEQQTEKLARIELRPRRRWREMVWGAFLMVIGASQFAPSAAELPFSVLLKVLGGGEVILGCGVLFWEFSRPQDKWEQMRKRFE